MSKKDDDEVQAEGSTIFFFCDVTTETVRSLCRHLKKLSKKYDTIRICIRSDGGCLYGGYAAMDYIRGLQDQGITIETEACGYCASAAVDILLVGSRRFMGRHAYILIHQLSQVSP